jgi:uncharacterized membrane protein YeaQ/YmgE (transglycosylase-associated protein family)
VRIEELGAICFGFVIGWIAYRTLRRTGQRVAVSDIATVVGAVGGAAIAGLFQDPLLFAWYSIGLAAGFFLYLILGHTLLKGSRWLGGGE